MENQHRKITGYRELDEAEIALMNRIKGYGSDLEELILKLRALGDDLDQRWVSIAATHFQEGLMAATRAVAQPESF